MLSRTMDREALFNTGQRVIVDQLQRFMVRMRLRGAVYTDWCGLPDYPIERTWENIGEEEYDPVGLVDEWRIPWFTYWEYSAVLKNSGVLQGGYRVLDLGGAASAFDAFIASKNNQVVVVERRDTVEIARKNAKIMGLDLKPIQGDMANVAALLKDAEPFDHVVSISNLFLCGTEALAAVKAGIGEFTVPNARLSFSFDFLNPNPKRLVTDPVRHFAIPGWKLRDDGGFTDNGKRYHTYYPDAEKPKYTAATLFMERER